MVSSFKIAIRMSTRTWNVTEARAKLSDVIRRAQSEGPQTIMRNGRKIAVVVAAEQRQRKSKRQGNLAEFLAASPFRSAGVKIERLRGRLREIDL